MGGVKGRVALVTGAGSGEGIGFATARLLKAAGARVAGLQLAVSEDLVRERLRGHTAERAG